MRWSDDGIVLAARRHGESALLVHLLTREHGRHAGLVRGGQRPKTRTVYQIGNRVAISWNGRLDEHLGTIQGELGYGYAARFIEDRIRLAALAAAAAVAEATLPEREPHQRAYERLGDLLDSLAEDRGWAVAYVRWEMILLADLGFGLDLARCAASGSTEALTHVSPRSGQAVSAAAAVPYRDRLLRLPAFLRIDPTGEMPPPHDVLDGLALTAFFLERRVLVPQHRTLPAARARFVDALCRIVISGQDTAKVILG